MADNHIVFQYIFIGILRPYFVTASIKKNHVKAYL